MEDYNYLIDENYEEDILELCYTDKEELSSTKYDERGLKYSSDGKRLLKCKRDVSTSLIIPEGVEIICNEAFKNIKKIESIVLPQTIKYIGTNAFESTEGLKYINFPSKLEYIGEYAFLFSSLKKVDLSCTQIKHIKESSFFNCEHLRTIILPTGLLSIEDAAFDGVCCREFIIPKSVLYLGSSFVSSSYLKELVIPSSVKHIGVFSASLSTKTKIISELKDTIVEDNIIYNSEHSIIYKCLDSKEYFEIPNTIKTIAVGGFQDCSINEVEFEEDSILEEIGDESFANSKLRKIEMSPTLKKIGNYAFKESLIETIVLPNSVESIGREAFAKCYRLKEIWLSSNLKEIGEDVFKNDNAIINIYITKGQKKRFEEMLPNLKEKIEEYEIEESLSEDKENEDVEDWDYKEDLNLKYPIEIVNDVNQNRVGLSFDSINTEIVSERQISVFIELSGTLKEDFLLNCALHDFQNKTKSDEFIEYVSDSVLKYRGKVNTILSFTLFLDYSVEEIKKLRLRMKY